MLLEVSQISSVFPSSYICAGRNPHWAFPLLGNHEEAIRSMPRETLSADSLSSHQYNYNSHRMFMGKGGMRGSVKTLKQKVNLQSNLNLKILSGICSL
jgi:hypothetical protein